MKQIKDFIHKIRNISFSSIQFKLPLALFSFLIIIIALLWILEIGMLDVIYQKIQTDNIEKTGTILTNQINRENLQDTVNQISMGNDICVLITDEHGRILSRSNQKNCDAQIDMYSFLKRVEAANHNNGIYLEEVIEKEAVVSDGASFLIPDIELRETKELQYTKIIQTYNQVRILFLSTALTPLSTSVETLKTILMIVTVFMSIAALLLGLGLSHMISKPLLVLSEKASYLGKDKQVDFNVEGYKEVKQLSETLHQAHEDLQEVERLRNELIANISHDLKTPLTMIAGYAEMMRDLPDENNQENLQVILDETQYLTRLVNDVLDLSKLQAGAGKLNISRFNLSQLILTNIERIQPLSSHKIQFDFDESVWVEADEMKISQVLYNFISNAVNHSQSDVEICQLVSSSHVRIEIKDHGKGIQESELDKIWDCYYRTNQDHVRSVTGTGLGLYIIKQILELHKSAYGVDSVLNEGSTFWFELKLIDKNKAV